MSIIAKFVELTVKVERKKLITVQSAHDVAAMAGELLADKATEHLFCFHLNKGNKVIAIELLAKGDVDGCGVKPSTLFRGAIVNGATAIILAHNHPSGRVEFSPEDYAMTAKAIKIGELLGVAVLDHVVVADDVVSMRETTRMFDSKE